MRKTLQHFFVLWHKKVEHIWNFHYNIFYDKNTKEIINMLNTDIIANFIGLRNVTIDKICEKTNFIKFHMTIYKIGKSTLKRASPQLIRILQDLHNSWWGMSKEKSCAGLSISNSRNTRDIIGQIIGWKRLNNYCKRW